MFGGAARIREGSSDGGEVGGPFMEDSDSSPSGIGNSLHVIEGAGYFTVSAACALSMVNLDLRHPCPPVLELSRFQDRVVPSQSIHEDDSIHRAFHPVC